MDQHEPAPGPPESAVCSWDVVVTGHVQGVGYRYFAQQAAQALGITGWVRNEAGGQVRALIQHADTSVLSRMVVALKHGPPRGWVQDCAVTLVASAERYAGFAIRG